jgi:predicted O-methyltransferase YrrM
MDFLPEEIQAYAEEHSQNEPELLKELFQETWQKVLNPRMLSGAFQGRLLALLSKLVQPGIVVEIGTYTGYSALCLAEGLKKDGRLITIDKNEELVDFSQRYFNRSPFKENIFQLQGNALELIPSINEKIDLAFIDADKSNYCNYFNLLIEKMNSGGIILSDNVLWSGKVLKKPEMDDVDTKGLIAYNKLLANDPRVETVLLPIRDGLTISRVI